MKKSRSFFFFVLFFFVLSSSIFAGQLISNLKEPGPTRKAWIYHPDPSCKVGSPPYNWEIHAGSIDGTPCTGGSTAVVWHRQGDKYVVQLVLDNTRNSQLCEEIKPFIAIQPRSVPPFGFKDILYLKDLSKLVVKATIRVGDCTSACDHLGCYMCPNWGGQMLAFVAIDIGIPIWDDTYKRNLWLEIATYWTEKAQMYCDVPHCLFWGEDESGELYRITVEHPLINQPIAYPGGPAVSYEIDLLPIIKSLPWGKKYKVDWNALTVNGLYVGPEVWGWAAADVYVSNIDFLYAKKDSEDNGAKEIIDEMRDKLWDIRENLDDLEQKLDELERCLSK